MSAGSRLVAKKMRYLPATESTNTFLKSEIAKTPLPEGYCVLTDYQTSGRGQFGNSWQSEDGKNLLFSVLFYPHFISASESYRLTMSVCLAFTDLAAHFQLKTSIKWPNDWYWAEKKLAGTLLESSIRANKLEWCIAGVGLNVEQLNFQVPQASSLRLAGVQESREEVFQLLVGFLERRYLELNRGAMAEQHQEFNRHLLGYGEVRTFKAPEETFKARVLGVDVRGYLELEKENGHRVSYGHKEVFYVFD